MGRAARHQDGHVIMYADKITRSMRLAINEVTRRRRRQQNYNRRNNVQPRSVEKPLRLPTLPGPQTKARQRQSEKPTGADQTFLQEHIKSLQFRLELYNRNLQFQKAIELQAEIDKLKKLVKK
ncbi:MAG: hypothetical protein COU85_02730 [Candidatus Portnoybacteria bacterium CG10_big_fil_rev_8_21_14_0_10_44_7]|uniref:UvrB YAD/RRR-motif-containing domain-containing protein n=1 Tax=Candidatus Portnoybacteria bacterium CG10_big_fil_rev_8_21_14_0_10_44_7 TaxID=1974816 RepID=A0A2M8KI75_9BACT|nr:MAG: hypothetical protein COU85_02730 [Candidatus Portnoybacteria bacterium CG10_big_fil_rev_8_21_14_0_10_44_7]